MADSEDSMLLDIAGSAREHGCYRWTDSYLLLIIAMINWEDN